KSLTTTATASLKVRSDVLARPNATSSGITGNVDTFNVITSEVTDLMNDLIASNNSTGFTSLTPIDVPNEFAIRGSMFTSHVLPNIIEETVIDDDTITSPTTSLDNINTGSSINSCPKIVSSKIRCRLANLTNGRSNDTHLVTNETPVLYAGATNVLFFEPKKGIANIRSLVSENVCEGVELLIPMNIVETFNSKKGLEDVLENGPWMIQNILIILKKWTMNTSHLKEEFTRIPVWVKLHDVPIQVFSKDGISLIATQIGKPIILDSFTSSMCIDSWGRSRFARCLIEINADGVLKESINMGIPLLDGFDFSKETVRVEIQRLFLLFDMTNDGFKTVVNKRRSGKTGSTNNNGSRVNVAKTVWQPIKPNVIFEPKVHGKLPRNGAPKVSTSAKEGSNIMHTSLKKQPTRAIDIPSSSYISASAKKGGLKAHTSSSNIPISNPYDLLSQEFDPDNYTRSGGDLQDDLESGEEVEVVFDETTFTDLDLYLTLIPFRQKQKWRKKPCRPDGMEAEYKKLMGQDDEPSSPTSKIAEEDIIKPPPPGRGRDFCGILMSSVVVDFLLDGFGL
ncbi:zinc knuckle CX2CX4HX4C containing protein, partial [Tanacetum coccineum]